MSLVVLLFLLSLVLLLFLLSLVVLLFLLLIAKPGWLRVSSLVWLVFEVDLSLFKRDYRC
jgi:hypothetical protein